MADVTPKSEGRKGARKHSGLGRGLGALIPQAGEQTPQATPIVPSRPLDVFFPEGPAARGRGGSAKDLLQPKRVTASSKHKRPAMPALGPSSARTQAASSSLGTGFGGATVGNTAADASVNPASSSNVHVKHRVITSCFRCRVLLSLRFLSTRSSPIRSNRARSSTRMT